MNNLSVGGREGGGGVTPVKCQELLALNFVVNLTHFSAVAYPQGFCFACLLRICEFPGNVIDATKLHQAPIKELAV